MTVILFIVTVTMWIAGSNHWRLYAYCWHINANTRRIFSFYVEIMNVLQSIEFMDFMTNVKGDIQLNYGRFLQTALIVYL